MRVLPYPPQQLPTSIFKQGHYEFEGFGTVVIRVGNVGVIVLREVIRHAHYFALRFFRRCDVMKLAHIVVVHRHDKVEAGEICRLDGARTVREVVTTAQGTRTHTAIGQFAFVVVNHTRRINLKLRFHPCLTSKRAEDFFSGYGATDVAEADKENFHLVEVMRLKVEGA